MSSAKRRRAAILAAGIALTAALTAAAMAQTASFEIPTTRMDQARDVIIAQGADPKWKREATLPEDWVYVLADGVTTRQVSFYVDGGTRLYGKLYLPKGFDPKSKSYPAVVVGHGINAVSLGIEKYAARIAERGIPAMAIDYQSYGYSDSGTDELLLQAPDTSTDRDVVTLKNAPVKIKRTNLNNVHEVQAFRAAVSFLQGEAGIDPNRIGTWATSNGGSVTHQLITVDGRVKASVIHVMSTPPGAPRQVNLTGPALTDAIQRVKTGQGGESDAGFSFPTKIDTFGNTRNRDINGPGQFDRVRPTTAILWLPAERDQLVGNPGRGAIPTAAYFKGRGVPAQVIVFPTLTHFQPYSGPAFEVGSNLAADWYIKHLGEARPAKR